MRFASCGRWPKNSSWSGQQATTDWLQTVNWDWTTKFRTLTIPEEMQKWTTLDSKHAIRYYGGLRPGRYYGNEEWMKLRNYDAERLWQNVMLWCLKYREKLALMLLLATLKGRKYRPPRYVVSECLTFLARHFLFKVANPNTLAFDAIWLLSRRFIDGAVDQDRSFLVSQHLIYLVLQYSDDLRMLSFYELLSSKQTLLHVHTMLHLLDRFVDMGRINLSMGLLETIANTGFDLSKDRIQMACVKLLRARFEKQEEYTIRSSILTRILEMGIKLNLHMVNAIILNAGEGGDFASAWQMYGLVKENALEPDSVTYSMLLKGAILSGDLCNLEMGMREIQKNKDMLQVHSLLSLYLHAASLMSPGDEFIAMLDVYKQHCDLRPLRELSLCGDETQAPPGVNCRGVWPSSYILTQMIVAYVRRHQGSSGLIHNYNLYYQHVKENHPLIAPLAKKDIVANSFIMAFGMKPSTLQHCPTVVRHMLEFSSQNFATSDSVLYAAPMTQTWSILVAAYFRNSQRRAAEKVLDMMRERGIQRDTVTWNTLVSAYAGLQDVNAVVATVKMMEAANFEMNSYTIKGMRKLRLQDRLREALEASKKEPVDDKGDFTALVPPLNSEERYEANLGLEWGSTTLNQEEEIEKYLTVKEQEMEMEKRRDSSVASRLQNIFNF